MTVQRPGPRRPLTATFAGDVANRSGTATGSSQTLVLRNTGRKYLLIQNPSTNVNTLWIAFEAAAVQASPSVEIPPGATMLWEGEFKPSQQINLIAIAGTVFTCIEA